jgi:hypothetical protein
MSVKAILIPKISSSTYDIAAVQVTRSVTCHPDDCALQFSGVCQTAQGNILDPIILDMPPFVFEEIDDEVGLHVSWAEVVDSDPVWPPFSSEGFS